MKMIVYCMSLLLPKLAAAGSGSEVQIMMIDWLAETDAAGGSRESAGGWKK